MKTKATTKTVTYLNYSLSREEQEIMAKSNKILEQVFTAIEECTNIDLNDQQKLVDYFHSAFNEDMENYGFTICRIIDCIINNSDISFIAEEEQLWTIKNSQVKLLGR